MVESALARTPTRVVGIIGWPVAQSLSPLIHNAAFTALGLDWTYVPLPVEPGRLHDALLGLPALGFAGVNVTMPHKEEASELVSRRSEDAELTRAVNTIDVTSHGLVGHNTDVPGFARFLAEDSGFDPEGRSAVVYGAGGAARACVLALARGGADSVAVVARDPTNAEAARAAGASSGVPTEILSWGDPIPERADLVVNATPIEPVMLPPLGPDVVVVDLVYRPTVTAFVAKAREAGAAAFTGLGMLLHQAALSFEIWTGQVPPLDVMSAAALKELAESR